MNNEICEIKKYVLLGKASFHEIDEDISENYIDTENTLFCANITIYPKYVYIVN